MQMTRQYKSTAEQRAKDRARKAKTKERDAVKQREWKLANRERVRTHALMRLYGITEAEFQALENSQDGKCKICGEVPNHRLQVDHCHSTGKIRGLLCLHCNTAIGHFNHDPATILAAINYLEKNND